MATLPIVQAPDPRLKTVSAPVGTVDDDLRRLMDAMLESMYAEPGIGLSAIQLGIPKRVVVADVSAEDEDPRPLRLVNPEIVWRSEEGAVFEEGCLSLPEHFADIERPAAVKLRYVDARGRRRELDADGLLARCLQHECDHLDGILFVDHLSAVRRGIILRKLAKRKKARRRDGD